MVFTQRLKWTRWSAGTLLHMLLSVLRWGGVSSSATEVKLCADLRGKGFHFVCVCTSQAYFKNTITNSRDTISNDCQCVFLPDSLVGSVNRTDAAKIAAGHLAAERSLARSVNTGTESKQGRASRCFRLHCRDKVMAEAKMVRKRHNTPETERKDGQSDVIDTSQSRKSPPATPNTNYKLQNLVFGLRFRNSAQPVNL